MFKQAIPKDYAEACQGKVFVVPFKEQTERCYLLVNAKEEKILGTFLVTSYLALYQKVEAHFVKPKKKIATEKDAQVFMEEHNGEEGLYVVRVTPETLVIFKILDERRVPEKPGKSKKEAPGKVTPGSAKTSGIKKLPGKLLIKHPGVNPRVNPRAKAKTKAKEVASIIGAFSNAEEARELLRIKYPSTFEEADDEELLKHNLTLNDTRMVIEDPGEFGSWDLVSERALKTKNFEKFVGEEFFARIKTYLSLDPEVLEEEEETPRVSGSAGNSHSEGEEISEGEEVSEEEEISEEELNENLPKVSLVAFPERPSWPYAVVGDTKPIRAFFNELNQSEKQKVCMYVTNVNKEFGPGWNLKQTAAEKLQQKHNDLVLVFPFDSAKEYRDYCST